MTLATASLPFGLRQVKLIPLLADGTLDSANAEFLPASRTFNFTDTESFQELLGDDTTIASHGGGPKVNWELEGGGISLAVWKILSGGTITSNGTTPAQQNTYSKLTTDSRPYFQVEGRAISDSGGDWHAVVYRCKADGDLKADNANGAFLLTSAKGTGYGNLTDFKLYDFTQNETPVPLTIGS